MDLEKHWISRVLNRISLDTIIPTMNIIHNDFELWNRIVKENSDIDVYYLPQYLELFQLNGDGKTQVAIVYIDKDNFLLFPYFLRKVKKSDYLDISSPYGYGGPMIKGNQIKINEFYLQFYKHCESNNIITSFVRFHLFDSCPSDFSGQIKNTNDVLIVNTNKKIEELFNEYNRSVRKSIRAAERNNVTVIIDEENKYLKEFYDIYIKTMQNNNANSYYFFSYEYFEKLIELLPNNIKFFHSIYENKIVASELILYSKRFSYSFLGGSLKEYIHMRTNNILKHKIIEWSHNNQIEYFVLGGGYEKDDGIFRYKQTFTKTEPIIFFIGKKIIMKKEYEEISKDFCAKNNLKASEIVFFPIYRYSLK